MAISQQVFQFTSQGASSVVVDAQNIEKAFNRSASSASALSKALGATQSESQKFAQGLGLTEKTAGQALQKLQLLTKEGATTQQRFNVLNKDLGITAQQFLKLDKAVQSQVATLERGKVAAANFAAAQREQAAAAQKATESLRNQEAGYQNVGIIAASVATAVGALAVKSVQTFVDLDKAVRTFGVITESSGTAALQGVREEVERLGASTTKTPQEIANLAVELGKAGFTADQVKSALSGVVLASQATGEGLARTGEVIGNVINQFQLSAKDTNQVADLLTATSNASASGTNDLGEALAYVGAQANKADQGLKDTLFALGLLANAGIKGSSAGTGLAEALRRIQLVAAGATTELEGMTGGALSKRGINAFKLLGVEVRNANGTLKPFPQIIGVLKKSLEGLPKGDQLLITNAIFGVQGGKVLQTLIGGNAEQTNNLSKALDNAAGSAQRAGTELLKGPAGALQTLQATTTTAFGKIGETLAVGFEPLVRGAVAVVQGFNSLNPAIQGGIIAITGFIGILAAAIAALSAYTLLNGAATVSVIKASAATIFDTVATGALTAGKLALALATGTATTAQIALAQSFALTAVKAGLIGGAIAAIGLNVDVFNAIKGSAAETRKNIDDLREGLAKLKAEQAVKSNQPPIQGIDPIAAENSRKFTESLNPAQKLLENIRGGFADLQKQINKATGGTEEFATASSAAANEQQVAFGELIGTVDSVIKGFEAFGQSGDTSAEGIKKQQEAIDLARKALEATKPVDQAGVASKEQYTKALDRAEASLKKFPGALKATTTETEKLATKQKEAVSALDAINDATEASLTGATTAEAKALAEIASLQEQGSLSKEQIEQRKLQATTDRITAELAAERSQVAQLQDLGKQSDPKEEKKRLDAIGKGNQKIAQLEVQAVEQRLKAREAAEVAALAKITTANEKAQSVVANAEKQRSIEIQSLLNKGVIDDAEAQRLKLNATGDRIAKELTLEKQLQSQIANDPNISKDEKEKRRADSIKKAADLQLQALENEAAKQEQVRQVAIKRIQQQAATQKAASDQAIAGLEAQKLAIDANVTAQDAVSRSLQRQQRLLDSSNNLQKALNDSAIAGTEAQLSGLDKAQQLAEQLAKEEDPRKKQALQQALNQLGFAGAKTQLDFAQRRVALEQQLANQRRAALLAEQTNARAGLELQIKREASEARSQALTAKRVELEAQANRLKAQQAVIDANAALEQAKLVKDPAERATAIAQAQGQITQAQNQITNADQQVANAGQQRQEAEQAVVDQQAFSAEARQTLAVQQQSQLATFNTNENIRQLTANLSLATTQADQLAAAMQKTATASSQTGAPQPVRGLYTGGTFGAGETWAGNERGPELVKMNGKTTLLGDGSPGLFQSNRSGTVIPARQSAAIMQQAAPARVVIPPAYPVAAMQQSISSESATNELKALRRDISKLQARQENSFNFVKDDDSAIDMMVKTQQRLQRARYGGRG